VPWTQRDVDWVAARLMPDLYDINKRVAYDRNTKRLEALYSELTMRRRLTEPAMVDGVMRPAGFEFEDLSAGPHRRTGDGFAYHPQFVNIPAMSVADRLKNKALTANGVVGRIVNKVESGLDEIIGAEQPLIKYADEAFAPHLAAISETKSTLDGVKGALDLLSNGGPPLPESGGEPKA